MNRSEEEKHFQQTDERSAQSAMTQEKQSQMAIPGSEQPVRMVMADAGSQMPEQSAMTQEGHSQTTAGGSKTPERTITSDTDSRVPGQPAMTQEDHEDEAAAAREDSQYAAQPKPDVGFPQEKIDEALLMQFLAQTVNGTVVQERFRKYAQPYRDMMAYYKCAMMEVATKFNVLDEELGLKYDRNPIESIRTRLKSPESILDKIHRKNVSPTVEGIEDNIFDIAGLRVIVTFPSDIYTLRNALLKQDDVTLIREKDYIANPKPNGYRSLHLIIETPIFLHDRKRFMKVEVQLRTLAMDWWASTEHKVRYKKEIENTPQLEHELLECANTAAALDTKMDRLHKMTEKQVETE